MMLLVSACRDSTWFHRQRDSDDLPALVKSSLSSVVRVLPKGDGAQPGGAGFFVRGQDGSNVVITNYHVIWAAGEISLERNDHTLDRAIVLGVDAETDLAVLRPETVRPGTALAFGDDLALRIGEPVVSIGSPAAVLNAVSVGILSARAAVPDATLPGESAVDYLFTDAIISPGCSGGPLLDTHGRVVGVNAAVVGGGHGLGVAIPSHLAARVTSVLERGARYLHSSTGLRVADAPLEGGGQAGVRVTAILAGGPGDLASLHVGDIIMALDGQSLMESSDLRWREFMDAPGTVWKLRVKRGGNELPSLTLSLRELSSGGPKR